MNLLKILSILICNLTFLANSYAVGDAEKGKAISGACATCHGVTGMSGGEDCPNLAGQKQAYLMNALQGFQTGKRVNATMQAQVGPLSAQDIENLAAYFAGNAPVTSHTGIAGDSILPSFATDTGVLHIPTVNVGTDKYQADVGLLPDGTYKIESLLQLK